MEGDVEWQGLDKGKIWRVIKIKDFYLKKKRKRKLKTFSNYIFWKGYFSTYKLWLSIYAAACSIFRVVYMDKPEKQPLAADF